MEFLITLMAIMGLGVIAFTFLLDKYYRKNRFVKYIPFDIAFVVASVCLIKAYFFPAGTKDIIYVMLLTFNYIFAMCSLLPAATIDIARYLKNRNKIRNKRKK